MKAEDRLDFELKNDIRELAVLSRHLEEMACRAGIPGRTMLEVNLALDELFTNIISYGFPQGGEHRIRFRLSAAPDVLTIVIEDDGVPFDPVACASAPPPPCALEERRVGGLGLHLVRKLVDEMTYRRSTAGRNVLTLRKRIDRQDPPAPAAG